MPSQLPVRVVVTGLLSTVWRNTRAVGRLALVAFCWFCLVPLVVAYIWHVLFPSDWAWRWDGAYGCPGARARAIPARDQAG